jgi:hypothetical protein
VVSFATNKAVSLSDSARCQLVGRGVIAEAADVYCLLGRSVVVGNELAVGRYQPPTGWLVGWSVG